MATDTAKSAQRSGVLSAVLWLVWPLVLFFPMWVAPLIIETDVPADSYALMAEQLLPHGLLGLVIVGFFSHTMAMCSSDANAIAAVVTRDIMPAVSRRVREWDTRAGLLAARWTTLLFLGLSMAIATQVNSPFFGDIVTVVIKWVAGLMGPIAIPPMLGLLPWFRKSGPTAALLGWGVGLVAFWLVNYPISWNVEGGVPLQYQVSVPLVVSLVLYVVVGWIKPEATPERDEVLSKINSDGPSGPGGAEAGLVPTPAAAAD